MSKPEFKSSWKITRVRILVDFLPKIRNNVEIKIPKIEHLRSRAATALAKHFHNNLNMPCLDGRLLSFQH